MIPGRGAWLEFEVDKKDFCYVRSDRKRKQPVTILLKALGFGESDDELLHLILDANGNPYESIRNTLEKGDVLWGELLGAAVADVQQTQGSLACAQWEEPDRLIARGVAAIARARLALGLRAGGQ